MKILTGIDLPFLPSCGSMILCDDLYNINSENHEIKFLALGSKDANPWSKLMDVKLFDIEKIYEPNRYPEYVLQLKNLILKEVTTFKPDIIHIQHLGFGMALALSEIEHIPKIALCHGTDVLFSLDNEFHKNNLLKVLSSVECVVCPTKNMLSQLQSIVPSTTKNKYMVVPWGVPDYLLKNRKTRTWSSQGVNILYAGRWSSEKNIQLLIKAMNLLDGNSRLTIIGEGNQQENLYDLVNALNLESKIRFEKFFPREQLWKKFDEYDAIVITTKDVEAFCLVAIEAQAHGLPVIHTNVGGLEDVIGNSGLKFEHERHDDLARQIKVLFNDPDLMTSYSRLGVDNAQKYEISYTQNQLLEISQNILNENIK